MSTRLGTLSALLRRFPTGCRESWRDRSGFERSGLIVALAIPVWFVLHTGQIWEDFFITYRHSENLVHGHGLVFQPGERVHGFTSVINTLLPALFAWVFQAPDFALPLTLYRIVSLGSLFFGLYTLAGLDDRRREHPAWAQGMLALFPVVAVLEVKITAFTMNGQEAGLMLGFLSLVFALSYRGWPRNRVLAGALAIAGTMYTRPDGFVYLAIIMAAGLLFAREPRRETVSAMLRSVGLGVLLFLPWMIFAQFYYGSFIPHTVVAKNGTHSFAAPAFHFLAPVVAGFSVLPERLCGALSAIYDFQRPEPGAWPRWVHDAALGFELIAVSAWVIPSFDRLGRMASLCALLMAGYLAYASLIAYSCPWYYPALSLFSLLALVRLLAHLPALGRSRLAAGVSCMLGVALVGLLAFVFLHSLRGLRIKQEITDWGHRRAIGLWLRDNVRADETVYLEPLGYIGYFSQRNLRDWPGLVAPEVAAARQKIGRPKTRWSDYPWAEVAEEIQPDWIVARPVEAEQLKESPRLSRDYQLVRVFNVAGRIEDEGEFPGSFISYNDAVFLIFRRKGYHAPAP